MAHPLTASTRAFTATLIAVAPARRLAETSSALQALRSHAAVRAILVTLGNEPQPQTRDEDGATIIEGLIPRYLNNAVAALRLSSLPAVAWWRGGETTVLEDLATLVDRVVLDSIDPIEDWAAAVPLVETSSFSDLRWTRLTRWRNLMAQFFDVPDVRAAADRFTQLHVAAADVHSARLFAGWLVARLPAGKKLAVEIEEVTVGEPLASVVLTGSGHGLQLRLMPNGTCIHTSIETGTQPVVTRIVPRGDRALPALLEEELRVRARDIVFEQALRFAAEAL